MTADETYEERRQRERIEEADARFGEFRRYLGQMSNWHVPAFRKAVGASGAIREYRNAHNQLRDDYLEERVTMHVVRQVWADEIEAAASGDPLMDKATVAVIVAGLRCPRRPYCTGCVACQTVTAPHRPCAERSDP